MKDCFLFFHFICQALHQQRCCTCNSECNLVRCVMSELLSSLMNALCNKSQWFSQDPAALVTRCPPLHQNNLITWERRIKAALYQRTELSLWDIQREHFSKINKSITLAVKSLDTLTHELKNAACKSKKWVLDTNVNCVYTNWNIILFFNGWIGADTGEAQCFSFTICSTKINK